MKKLKPLNCKNQRKNKKTRKFKNFQFTNNRKTVKTETSIDFDFEQQKTLGTQYKFKQKNRQDNFLSQFFKNVTKGYNFFIQQKNLIQKIEEIHNSLCSISIDRLLSYDLSSLWQEGFIFSDLYGYLKIVKNKLHSKEKNIILSKKGESLSLTCFNERHPQRQEVKGKFVSLLQVEVFQNRQNFIEKIKQNYEKYKNQNSILTQISQQLLFLSKIYLSNNCQIKNRLQHLSQRVKSSCSQPEDDQQLSYLKILLQKNQHHAFNEQEINQLNYFQLKEYEQGKYYQLQQKNHDEKDFFNFLLSKKHKKSKSSKNCLLTACSACFSDKYEQYNPLLKCQGCKLRCHKLCLDLKRKKCGNCAYQRLSKKVKTQIHFCVICKQNGFMNIQIDKFNYAHYFCLLFHGLGEIRKKLITFENSISLQQSLPQNQFVLNQKNKTEAYQSRSLEYQVFFQIPWTLFNKQEIGEVYLSNQQVPNQEKGNLRIHQPLHNMQVEQSKQKLNRQKTSICQICRFKILENFHVNCNVCNKKYHAYCSYFEGFSFRIIKEECIQNKNKFLIQMKCCQNAFQNKQALKRKRKFILNKDKFLFTKLGIK